jgi:hypothetical protein
MKQIVIQNGGMPFDLDDIDYSQNAVKEALCGFIGAITSGNCILQGCNYSETAHPTEIMLRYANITSGFVWIGGEVCRVEVQRFLLRPAFDASFNTVYPTAFLEKKTIFDPNGLEAFADGVTRDTYSEQVGELIADFLPESASKMRCDAMRLRQILGIDNRDIVINRGSGWNGEAITRRLNGGAWLLSGRLEGLTASPILTLNTYCRPSKLQFCAGFSDNGDVIMLRLDINGVITVAGAARFVSCNLNLIYI